MTPIDGPRKSLGPNTIVAGALLLTLAAPAFGCRRHEGPKSNAIKAQESRGALAPQDASESDSHDYVPAWIAEESKPQNANTKEIVLMNRQAAERGEARAQYRWGFMAEWGYAVRRDVAEAAKWYRKAADQGVLDAQKRLGLMYAVGKGVGEDQTEAIRWQEKAAEQGDTESELDLAMRYRNGVGVPQDYSEALKWFRRAADQGDVDAQTNVGAMYHNGDGVPRDFVEAYKWFNLAAARASSDEARKQYADTRDQAAQRLTRAQMTDAQNRAREWMRTFQQRQR